MNRWFARSWNPLHGCRRLCSGCDNCCALANLKSQGRPTEPGMNRRILDRGIPDDSGVVQVCSLGDFFHEDYADSVRDWCLEKMLASRGNRFVILTRRPGVALNYFTMHRIPAAPANPGGGYGSLWIGASAECQDGLGRLDCLREIPVPIHRVLALEPLLEPVDLTGRLDGIEWVIVGSESGERRRPAKLEWIRGVVRQCRAAGIPVMVDQLEIDGECTGDPARFPADLQCTEYPWQSDGIRWRTTPGGCFAPLPDGFRIAAPAWVYYHFAGGGRTELLGARTSIGGAEIAPGALRAIGDAILSGFEELRKTGGGDAQARLLSPAGLVLEFTWRGDPRTAPDGGQKEIAALLAAMAANGS